LPSNQFTETDAYFYYWQASLISEHGHLPARDMHRWLPVGRDLGQTLNLYGYVLAYTHKFIASVFPNITLYQVCLYMPVVCFCIGLGALCLYLYHAYELIFFFSVGVILATLPGSIERSAAGFGDRDAFCLMLGILAVVTYLVSLQISDTPRKSLFWTLASGFTVFLGGMSWEGFGVFLSVIIVVELWRFLMTETEDRLGLYAVWVCCFVPTLYLASPAYRRGYGFSEHLAVFVLLPPIILLAMRAIRFLLISKVARLHLRTRTVSFILILASVSLALGYVWAQQNTFADTSVPISNNPVMQAMTELRAPHFGYWVFRYGSVFILGSIGLMIASKSHYNQPYLLIPIILFVATTFFREPLEEHLWSTSHGTFFFSVAVICIGIGFLISAWLQKSDSPRLMTIVAFMAWFIFWVSLARDAKRYDFFIGVPLAFFTAEIITFFSNPLSRFVKQHRQRAALKTGIAIALLAGILFLPPLGAHATRALHAATRMRKVTPTKNVGRTLDWMKAALPNTAIVAAHWGYGSQLNVLGGVKTIIDQDTYLQNWILLYNRHVHNTTSEHEALEYLKTHGATHLMLTRKDPKNSFLRGELSEAFLPIYPKVNFADATVKVWKIHYPPDIQTNPKYLKTGFPEIDDHLPLQ
jgi:asparagine N-glycosylation enzyme membrane subunit Stt3